MGFRMHVPLTLYASVGQPGCSAGAARFASVRDCVCALRLGTLRQIAVSVSGVGPWRRPPGFPETRVLGVTVSAPPGVFESVGILHSILHVDHSNARARAPNKTNHERLVFILNGSAFTVEVHPKGTRLFHASFHVPKCPTKDSE